MDFQLELTLQFCLLIKLFQEELVLLKEMGRVFSALRELLLKRKVDNMSFLQLEKKCETGDNWTAYNTITQKKSNLTGFVWVV